MAKAEWLDQHIQYIKGLKSPGASQQLLVELAAIENPTKADQRELNKLVRLEKLVQQQEAAKAEAFRILSARREEQRKARTRELIELGGIVAMVDFPVDRGTLTGALLWALDQMKTHADLPLTLKKRGDAFLAQREDEKKGQTQGSAEAAAKEAAAV
ncbi:hypothetical protein R75465_07886 [Paraburkholderia aspalathi]|uniref:conjugal transfer protein TraD n=1 Tax=Paraburkholderia aspalathi TaxID=1324617 RepID=UPI001B2BB898|nr:conjugal transfer protein TraD [Paraburkholderia aspalathi]CAE6864839.1 hypothetical protein R75465_07886 [Paraburkholderia aspalathi]